MYALALFMSAGATAATLGFPHFHLGQIDAPIPIQWFGMIVAAGLIIGAIPLRRYAEWHGVGDDHIRGVLTWLLVTGFLGAHEFDVIAYQWDKLGEAAMVKPASWWFLPEGFWPSNWPLVLRIWDGISSYGGFIGGGLGWAFYVWWKRLPMRLFADIALVGLLPAFSIGRIGCTVVSDHIGAYVDPDAWYSFLAMEYPRKFAGVANLVAAHPGTGESIRAWNLGLIEFLYLVPVNLVVLWLAFRPSKRLPAGFIAVLVAVLYAPVRFFLDFLRPEDTDPRLWGLTFAQWSSILALGVAIYAARRVLKTGTPAETVAPTSREAQERLRIVLRDEDEVQRRQAADRKAEADRKKAQFDKLRADRDREAEAEAGAASKAVLAGKAEAESASADQADAGDDADAEDDAEADDEADAEAAGKARAAATSAVSQTGNKPASKPGARSSGKAKAGKKKNRKR